MSSTRCHQKKTVETFEKERSHLNPVKVKRSKWFSNKRRIGSKIYHQISKNVPPEQRNCVMHILSFHFYCLLYAGSKIHLQSLWSFKFSGMNIVIVKILTYLSDLFEAFSSDLTLSSRKIIRSSFIKFFFSSCA